MALFDSQKGKTGDDKKNDDSRQTTTQDSGLLALDESYTDSVRTKLQRNCTPYVTPAATSTAAVIV